MEFHEYLDRFSGSTSPAVIDVGDGFALTMSESVGALKSMASGKAENRALADAVWLGYHAGAYAMIGRDERIVPLLESSIPPDRATLIESEFVYLFNTTGFTIPPLNATDDVAPYVDLMRSVSLRSRQAIALYHEEASKKLTEAKADRFLDKVSPLFPSAFLGGTSLAMIAINVLASVAGITEPQEPPEPPDSPEPAESPE